MKRLLLAALCTAATAAPGFADETVSKMTYKNNGAYNAFFNVRYNLDGKNCAVYLPGEAFTGDAVSGGSWKLWKNTEGALDLEFKSRDKVRVDLTSADFEIHDGPDRCLTNGKIPEGQRVWGKVTIQAGDEESCKKSISLLAGTGGATAEYRTGGTTLNNNRCKQNIVEPSG